MIADARSAREVRGAAFVARGFRRGAADFGLRSTNPCAYPGAARESSRRDDGTLTVRSAPQRRAEHRLDGDRRVVRALEQQADGEPDRRVVEADEPAEGG